MQVGSESPGQTLSLLLSDPPRTEPQREEPGTQERGRGRWWERSEESQGGLQRLFLILAAPRDRPEPAGLLAEDGTGWHVRR